MVALIGVSVLVQSVSVSLFDETLTAQFEQSPIAVLGNFPVILGFIVSGRQLLLRYERALEDEHALVRTLIDTLPDNLFVKDRESRIVIDNVAHARLLGNSTPDQVIGKTDFDFFPPELAQKYYEDEQQIIRTGEAKINLEETTIDPQGNEHWLMTSKVLIRDEAGQIAGIVGINRDITEQKRIEIERDQSLQVEQDQREYLQMLIGKIRASASILNNVAAEIQVATTQQVASTLEQETAVTQTVATVEEVRTTVQQTAERAQQVAHTATESVSTSRTGQEAVAQTVDSVSQIKQQVEDIAGSILALSERTQQIGEIIDTVNGLADQSKLLALNASIEAARAGEEGKGFAVVAMEVRQLAEQSREATGRVRDILSEIQQATNSAVMVTEQGSKGAEIGLSLVELAGEAIRELAVTIEGAAQAATQIAASTHQQTNGMEQLAAAMMQIKAASGQSAVSARQTENSVREMIDIAQQLEAAVAQYQ
jgi:PAS domain S-box-containing protein